jgi:hypothetical protein
MNPACHVVNSVTLANAGNFTKAGTLFDNKLAPINSKAAAGQIKTNNLLYKNKKCRAPPPPQEKCKMLNFFEKKLILKWK